MNFFPTMFALLAARKSNDSPADAARIALVSMAVKPPIMGLLLGVTMAKQAAPALAVPANNTGIGRTKTSQGASLLAQVAPGTHLHSFLPSFIGFTRKQAAEFAEELNLNVEFAPESSGHRVGGQSPAPGTDWPHKQPVTLYLE